MSGTVYWITGLTGAGKSTVAELLCERLRQEGKRVLLLDGDQLRDVFGNRAGYNLEDRFQFASSYGRLCKMLACQGTDVVCATISMFAEVRDWNRRHIDRYLEIYLRTPMETLIERDTKGLYKRAMKGEISNVYGIDLDYDEPRSPDLLFNAEDGLSADRVAALIQEKYKELMSKEIA